MRLPRRLLLLLALLLCLPAIAACGGGSGGSGGGGDDPDPAQAMPGDVPFYLEATVRPEGSSADAIEALTAKFGVEDPGQRIIDYLESSSEDSDVTYAEDIEPWLGKRVGFGIGAIADDPPFLAAAGVTDADAAAKFIESEAEGAKKEYKGTSYWPDEDGTFGGVAGDFLLLSDDEAQFKRLVDQVDSGEKPLSDQDGFTDAVGELPDERVGTFYVAAAPLFEQLKRQPEFNEAGAAAVLQELYGGFVSVAGALTPYENRAVLEVRTKTDGSSETVTLFNGLAEAPDLVKEVPADALAVYGAPKVGESYKAVLDQVAGALGGAALKGQLQSQLGIDLDRDVFAWIGDAALFVRGTSVQDLNGALMIDATDEDAAAAALPKLIGLARQQGGITFSQAQLRGTDQAFEAQIPGAPAPLYVARTGTRVVLGLGEEATQMGLTPSASLDANGGYDRATQATDGIAPSIIVDAQKVVGLIEQAAGSDPQFQQAKPYLEPLASMVLGNTVDGDTQITRVAVTVE